MERMLGLAALLWAAPVAAQDVPAAPSLPTPAPTSIAAPESTPEAVLLEFRELATRMTVPVTIAAGGPWNFVVDTGAERTVVSRELATTLGLAAGPSVRVVALTGPEWVPTFRVPSLAVSSIAARGLVSPALAARDLGAVGMVGIDMLQDHSVVIDFDARRMTLRPSKKRRRPPVSRDDVVVTARSLYGQLIVTDARWRGRRIAVVVDTGTPVSIGNRALARLVGAPPAGKVELIAATGDILTADQVVVQGIEVGGVGFSDVMLGIADAAPFRRFGLSDSPALMMGMDMLRLFRMVRIDFPNREIRFTLPRGMRDGPRIGIGSSPGP